MHFSDLLLFQVRGATQPHRASRSPWKVPPSFRPRPWAQMTLIKDSFCPKDLPLCHMQEKALYHSFMNCIFLYRNQWKILEAEQSNFFSNVIACSKNILEPFSASNNYKMEYGDMLWTKTNIWSLSTFSLWCQLFSTTYNFFLKKGIRLSDFCGSFLFWKRQTCSLPPFLFNMQWNSNRVGT